MTRPFYHQFMATLGGLYVEVEAEIGADGDLIRIADVVQVGHDALPADQIQVVHQGRQMTLREAAARAFDDQDGGEIMASVYDAIGDDRRALRAAE